MTDKTSMPGVLVRADQAETLTFPTNTTSLFAEGEDTGGAFSALRMRMAPAADGARPHHHSRASELFFVIDGTVDILVDDQVVTARAGDFAVVRPGAMHAFANGSRSDGADLLIIFGPAIERFEYFRLLHRVVSGKATIADLLATQERFDNWFADSPAWNAHRAATAPR